jgi:low affinity Fe/Cu permease
MFSEFAGAVAHATGRPIAFIVGCAVIIVWAVTGPIFGFSDTWQLVVNTGTTVITFLMVFLIQNTQNRDGAAIQTKLDELIRSSAAQNTFVGIEHLTEAEVEEFRRECEERAKKEGRELSKHEQARVSADVAQRRVRKKAAQAAATF